MRIRLKRMVQEECIQPTPLLRARCNKKVILKRSKAGWLAGWLVWFYGISTLVGYSMPNSVFTYKGWTKYGNTKNLSIIILKLL